MNTLKKILKHILYTLSPRKSIIFESCPDFSDNTKAVFDEMLKRGLNKKYILVWLLFDNKKENYPKFKNVKYVNNGKKIFSFYSLIAKCYICCNRFLYSNNNYQKSFFLTHGMYVKRPTNYYSLPIQIDYCFSSSKGLEDIQAKALNVDPNKMVSLGFPRNDILTGKKLDLSDYFDKKYSKYIVWYPTFRQHKSGMGTGSIHSIPIIWNTENALRLNAAAKKHNTLIILKPHFAQDTSKIEALDLSNIKLINDDFLLNNNLPSYELINSCDSLLTDYSSIYFDYTLCDKPIGLVWEDYDDYEKEPGFALDMTFYMKGGVKIFNIQDFEEFVSDIAADNDILQEERRQIRSISNFSTDGKSSERVVDFIVSKANL